MSQSRGAAAPTSGSQNQVTVMESTLDEAIADVAAHAHLWAKTTPRERADLLDQIIRDTYAVSEEWNAVGCEAKGYDLRGAEAGVVMRKLLAFQVRPSWAKLPGLMAAALKG
jgi:acyl-CoA reductase-like NAD-dependent aldehyde dehydrogenase